MVALINGANETVSIAARNTKTAVDLYRAELNEQRMATAQVNSAEQSESGRLTLELEGVARRHREAAGESRVLGDRQGEITAEANRLEERLQGLNDTIETLLVSKDKGDEERVLKCRRVAGHLETSCRDLIRVGDMVGHLPGASLVNQKKIIRNNP